MEVTLTIKADASQELSEMLKALGIALQGESKPDSGIKDATAEIAIGAAPVTKQTRRTKKTEVGAEGPAPAEEKSPDDEPVTLESLREEVVALAKVGKSKEIKAIFKEFGAERLQDVKKENYKAVAAQLGSL